MSIKKYYLKMKWILFTAGDQRGARNDYDSQIGRNKELKGTAVLIIVKCRRYFASPKFWAGAANREKTSKNMSAITA
jgi:hypothetical protein